MDEKHKENMIFAILTIFDHFCLHQPLLKAPKIGFSENFFLDLAYGLSCTSHGLEDVGPVRLFFSGLGRSKIDRARACPATNERDTILNAVQNRPQVGFSFRNMMQWVQLEHPQLAEVW